MTESNRSYREQDYTPEIVTETLGDGRLVYVASYPELDGCMAHGETEQEARENLSEAFEMAMAHLVKFGLPIPAPRPSVARQVFLQSYLTPSNPSMPGLITVVESAQPVSFSYSAVAVPAEWLQQHLYSLRLPFLTLNSQPNATVGKAEALAEAS